MVLSFHRGFETNAVTSMAFGTVNAIIEMSMNLLYSNPGWWVSVIISIAKKHCFRLFDTTVDGEDPVQISSITYSFQRIFYGSLIFPAFLSPLGDLLSTIVGKSHHHYLIMGFV